MNRTREWLHRGNAILVGAWICVASTVTWADLTRYSQDFEGLVQSDPNALANDGWLVFGTDVVGSYGPFPAPNGGSAFSAIVTGEGGLEQGAQQLGVYSDYNNPNHPAGPVETNVFQEQVVGAGDVGSTWTFSWEHKKGNIELDSTALAFIKTIDPNNGFALTNFLTFDTTGIPATWGGSSLQIFIDASLAPGGTGEFGQILQFGFLTNATNFQGSGIFYDNVLFSGEGIDPADAGSQYAWGETFGWINAQPQGPGGPGVVVSDTELTGWMWAGDLGWISLSCRNTDSCAAGDYRVLNDGAGTLSGYAWGERLGRINFGDGSPGGEGVRVDPFTGVFSGFAWTERRGRINFGSADMPQATQIETGWRCPDPDGDLVCAVNDGCAAFDVAGLFGQTVTAQTDSVFGWPVATDYQVARGTFVSSQDIGSFTGSVIAQASGADHTDLSAAPGSGEGYWYLFRPDCPVGSYSTGSASEQGDRDGGLIP